MAFLINYSTSIQPKKALLTYWLKNKLSHFPMIYLETLSAFLAFV